MENQIIQDIIKDLGMTIGIEIETVRETNSVVLNHLRNEITDIEFNDVGYTHRTTPFWKIVRDGSTHGAELVSPILNQENVFDQITRICQSLNRMQNTEVNKSCGLHIHLKWNGMTVDHIKRIVKRYYDYQNDIDLIMPISRRGNTNQYCLQILPSDIRRIERHNGNLYQMSNLIKNGSYSTRYKKINLESLTKYGTVEFRQHSGTIDHTKILNWLSFLVGFVKNTIENQETTFRPFIEKPSAPFREVKNMFKMKNWTMKYGGGKKWNFFNTNNEIEFSKTTSELNEFYTRDIMFQTQSSLNDNFKTLWNTLFNENVEEETFYKGLDATTRTYLVDRHNHFATLEGRSTI